MNMFGDEWTAERTPCLTKRTFEHKLKNCKWKTIVGKSFIEKVAKNLDTAKQKDATKQGFFPTTQGNGTLAVGVEERCKWRCSQIYFSRSMAVSPGSHWGIASAVYSKQQTVNRETPSVIGCIVTVTKAFLHITHKSHSNCWHWRSVVWFQPSLDRTLVCLFEFCSVSVGFAYGSVRSLSPVRKLFLNIPPSPL